MKVVPASLKILDHLDQQSLVVRIEECGRICYKSEDKITPESALPFVEKVIKSGHNSVLEMGVVTLEIGLNDTQRGWMREIELFFCHPKYLHISRDNRGKTTKNLLISASIRAWREILLNHPDCDIVRAACALFHERHPFFSPASCRKAD
jgi:thymidylate synthase (FAD)